MVLPRPTARITHAAKLEFSSKDRSRKPGAGQAIAFYRQNRTSRSNKKDTNANEGQDKGRDSWFSGWSLSDKIAAIASLVSLLQFIALFCTVYVMVRTARRQLRAYVLPESGGLWEGMMLNPQMPVHAGEPGVTLLFKNSGQTPAYNYISWAQIIVAEPTNAHTLTAPSLQRQFPAIVGAGGTISKALWFGRPLTQSEIADVAVGAKLIFVYGRIEYVDAFRRKRWANFRLQYGGAFPPPPNVIFNFSDSGNDSN
jgi:hypothetical protein